MSACTPPPSENSDDSLENKKFELKYELIKAEIDNSNERIGAYSEADQKIIAAISTIVVAVIGLSASKYADLAASTVPYVLFLASALMTIGIMQSSLYSALILLLAERKIRLYQKMADHLSCDPNIADTRYSYVGYESVESYKFNVMPYYLFRGSIGLMLTFAGLCCPGAQYSESRFALAFLVSLAFSLTGAAVTFNHVRALAKVEKTVRRDYQNKNRAII